MCYAAERELILSRGLSALNQTVPPPWAVAPDSDKMQARHRVVEFLHEIDLNPSGWPSPNCAMEDQLAVFICSAFAARFADQETANPA